MREKQIIDQVSSDVALFYKKFIKEPNKCCTYEQVHNETTSSDELPAFIHQVRGQVIVSDVLMEAQEVQTARAQTTKTHAQQHNYKYTVKCLIFLYLQTRRLSY